MPGRGFSGNSIFNDDDVFQYMLKMRKTEKYKKYQRFIQSGQGEIQARSY